MLSKVLSQKLKQGLMLLHCGHDTVPWWDAKISIWNRRSP